MDPRRSIWGPVLITVALLAVGGLVPRGATGPRDPATTANTSWLAPPSWPAFALRECVLFQPQRLTHAWGPSWPVFALHPAARPLARGVAKPVREPAAPVRLAGQSVVVGTILALWLVGTLALLGRLLWPTIKGARRGRGGVDLALRVLTLAERGVEQRHIARHAGLPRDAVRAMLHRSAQTPRA
jgi:hypothetical protein